MFNTSTKREIKEIRPGDPQFLLTDGMIQYPRAMIHILPECPASVRAQIEWAMASGYLKATAYVQGKELTWQTLTG